MIVLQVYLQQVIHQSLMTVESNNTAITVPPTKKAKGLSKVLGHCLGRSLPHVLTPRQQVKQE